MRNWYLGNYKERERKIFTRLDRRREKRNVGSKWTPLMHLSVKENWLKTLENHIYQFSLALICKLQKVIGKRPLEMCKGSKSTFSLVLIWMRHTLNNPYWHSDSREQFSISQMQTCWSMTFISPGRLPNQAILLNSATYCLFRQHDFMQLCRIRQPYPKFIHGN